MSEPPINMWKSRYAPPPSKINEGVNPVQIFEIPEPERAEDRYLALVGITLNTGLPVDFSEDALRIAGHHFVSVRTSDEAIPRGSIAIEDQNGEIQKLADYKTTSVGSKSKLRGVGKGKLLWDKSFFDKDKGRDPDPKDNNSPSKFPDRLEDTPLLGTSAPEFLRLKQHLSADLNEVKQDPETGLIYCSINVPEYHTKKKGLSDTKKNPKHYCQEAETLASIFDNLDKHIYNAAQIKDKYLYFTDDNENQCRIDLRTLRLPPELQDKPEHIAANKALAEIKNVIALQRAIRQYKIQYNVDLLELCHAPLFTSKTANDSQSFVPVLVQTGDTGEAIIRDADFEHFYKHPLIPPLAQKSFNGGKQFQPDSSLDHLTGLELLKLRLESSTLDMFKEELQTFIERRCEQQDFLITLDKYTIEKIGELHPYLKLPTYPKNEYNLAELNTELQQIILLAKYGDVTTLIKDTPYINYVTDEFSEYATAVDSAHNYYKNNALALENIGESSTHDLVFLYELGHPMSMHGDEGGHPKGKPENFARITTYYDGKVIITNNEEQYLKLLLTNPEMLQNQTINIHPYWLRNLNARQDSVEYRLSKGWLDLLIAQTLKQALALQQYNDAHFSEGTNTIKAFEACEQAILLNIPRRFLSDDGKPGDAAMLANIRGMLAEHFAVTKAKLLDYNKGMLTNQTHRAMERMVDEIYATSPLMTESKDLAIYRVLPRKRVAAGLAL